MAKRVWTVMADPVSGELDRDEVARALLDIEPSGHRLGGVFRVLPVRRPLDDPARPGEFEVVGWAFDWNSAGPTLPGFVREPDAEGEPDGTA